VTFRSSGGVTSGRSLLRQIPTNWPGTSMIKCGSWGSRYFSFFIDDTAPLIDDM